MTAPSGNLQQDELEAKILNLIVEAMNDGMSLENVHDSMSEVLLCMDTSIMLTKIEAEEAAMSRMH